MSGCITTVVDAAYMPYVPLFVYCANRVYPDCDVKLFLRDPCDYDFGLKFEKVQMFQGFPRYVYNSIALRFVVPPAYYEGYDWVYVTDIDMMLMPEQVSIEKFHRDEMVQTGMCYSNSLRNVHHYEGSSSLSGLHFFDQRWLKKTEEQRARYYDLLAMGIVGTYREYDGVMLYRMAKLSGVGLPRKYKLKNRHHGIHLGNFRIFPDNKSAWDARITDEYKAVWNHYLMDKQFAHIIAECRKHSEMLDSQLTMMGELIG